MRRSFRRRFPAELTKFSAAEEETGRGLTEAALSLPGFVSFHNLSRNLREELPRFGDEGQVTAASTAGDDAEGGNFGREGEQRVSEGNTSDVSLRD